VDTAAALYSRDQVSDAVNAGANLLVEEIEPDDHGISLVDLVVNAALTLLDDPGCTDLNEVIRRCYDDPPSEVLSWRWPRKAPGGRTCDPLPERTDSLPAAGPIPEEHEHEHSDHHSGRPGCPFHQAVQRRTRR
jgi:hypothetical protein